MKEFAFLLSPRNSSSTKNKINVTNLFCILLDIHIYIHADTHKQLNSYICVYICTFYICVQMYKCVCMLYVCLYFTNISKQNVPCSTFCFYLMMILFEDINFKSFIILIHLIAS